MCIRDSALPLRAGDPGLPGLAATLMGQQVSRASATAITSRLAGMVDLNDAASILALDDTAFRTAGLSRAKEADAPGHRLRRHHRHARLRPHRSRRQPGCDCRTDGRSRHRPMDGGVLSSLLPRPRRYFPRRRPCLAGGGGARLRDGGAPGRQAPARDGRAVVAAPLGRRAPVLGILRGRHPPGRHPCRVATRRKEPVNPSACPVCPASQSRHDAPR